MIILATLLSVMFILKYEKQIRKAKISKKKSCPTFGYRRQLR